MELILSWSRFSLKRKAMLLISLCYVLLVLFLSGLYLHVGKYTDLVSPAATLFLEDCDGFFLAELGQDELGFWELNHQEHKTGKPKSSHVVSGFSAEKPGLKMISAILAVEDERFYEHSGIDVRAVSRALLHNLRHDQRQGASTIAMQVARLQLKASKRTYYQKLVEMMIGFRLIRIHGHEAVLNHYLKIVPMGNRIHGVVYAARRYFQKPLEDLSWAEVALLASLPKAPGRMNLFRFRGRLQAKKRAENVLFRLNRLGYIGRDEFNTSLRLLKDLVIQDRELRPESAFHAILRIKTLSNMAQEEVYRGKKFSYDCPLRTSLDMTLQEIVFDLSSQHLKQYRSFGAGNIAVIVAEKETGHIKSYIGSAGYNDHEYSGSINYAFTPRSSGSTLKPFIYAFGLDDGLFLPSSILSDQPLSMAHPSGHYSVTNYDFDYLGPVLYRKALANSRNIPAIEVLRQIGVDETHDRLTSLHLTRGVNRGAFYGLGLAVGGLYVTLEDLVAAYGVLANEGRPFALHWAADFHLTEEGPRMISEETARQISLFLSDALARLPSFPRMNALEYPFQVAVKTGTSQGFRDAWCVAYSQKYIVGVWMGHPDNHSMKNLGGVSVAALVKKIMFHLHPSEIRGENAVVFPPPRGYIPIELCLLTGDLATRYCSSIVTEYFFPGTQPRRKSQAHRQVLVDRRTGELADQWTPHEDTELKVLTVLEAQFADWGFSRGFSQKEAVSYAQSGDEKEWKKASASITSPVSGSHIFFDPEVSAEYQTLALRAVIKPAVPSVIWFVDGRPFREVEYPYSTRWPMQPGEHVFEIRFPNAHIKSERLNIVVH